jgi:hypothetical protein
MLAAFWSRALIVVARLGKAVAPTGSDRVTVRRPRTNRIRGLTALLAAILVFGVLSGPIRVLALADDSIPGVPLPKEMVEGWGDADTDRYDVYSVHLTAGVPASFTCECYADFDLHLFPPTSTDIIPGQRVAWSSQTYQQGELEQINYTPSVTGTYYLVVETIYSSGGYLLWGTWLPGALKGTVTSGGSPLAGVSVQVGSMTPTTTGGDGKYAFLNIAPGTYSVAYAKPGYATQTLTGVVVTSDSTTTREVALVSTIPGALTGTVMSGNTMLSGVSVTYPDLANKTS